MFYAYFRPFNIVCNVFGLLKPIITVEGVSIKINLWLKLWSILISLILISSYFILSNKNVDFDIKHNLQIVPDINDLIANVMIIIINNMNSEKICISLHQVFDNTFTHLKMNGKIIKLFVIKMYFWFSLLTITFLTLIIMEFVYSYPPYILMMRIPTFLSILHLFMHLYLLLAIMKVINDELSHILSHKDKTKTLPDNEMNLLRILKYILSPAIEFLEGDNLVQYDLKQLCTIYDNLSTSVHLLEKYHGLQIFLSIWLMFTSAVVGVTVIVCDQVVSLWLVIAKSVLPSVWCFVGCYINDQLSKEVDQTVTLIIKILIDYKCLPSRKPTLETFKELVINNRLQFTACSLFNLSYAMLLGTLLNVITYSIILIQLFTTI